MRARTRLFGLLSLGTLSCTGDPTGDTQTVDTGRPAAPVEVFTLSDNHVAHGARGVS